MNALSNSRCQGVSDLKAWPAWDSRAAWIESKSLATSRTARSACSLAFFQRVPVIEFNGGRALPAPTYLLTRCASVTGTYNFGDGCAGSVGAYSMTRHSVESVVGGRESAVVESRRVPSGRVFNPR